MKIGHLLRESAIIDKDGEKQKLVDPYDSLHTAEVAEWITVPLDKLGSFAINNGLKFFDPEEVSKLEKGQRGPYKLSINAIPLNQKRDNDEFAHIIKIKITEPGRKNSDNRKFVYYISYSNKEVFDNAFKGTARYPIERVDQLPIYAPNTGIGSNRNSRRDYWTYLAPDEGSTKGQDRLNPREFPYLNKHSFIDAHGSTGFYGNLDRDKERARKAELEVPDDDITDTERQRHLNNKEIAINAQNAAIIGALTAKKITADQMIRIIKNSRGSGGSYRSQKTRNYLADLTTSFIATPNSPSSIYPLQLAESVSGLELMKDIGIQGLNSIAVDFMEVLHPVILLYGNCNGNARSMAERFFGATQDELIKNAVISYTRDHAYPLIDSAIFYKSDNDRGFKRLGISTKQQGVGGRAGGSKFPSLQVAWREVQAIAAERWTEQVQPLIGKNKRYKLAWEALRYRMAVTGNENLLPQNLISDIAEEFSVKSTDPKESEKEYFSRVFLAVANSNEFKQLVIWIFNHSATIQIDTRADYGDSDRKQPGVISNIVATWPTQLASSVEVSDDGNDIKLVVDGRTENFTTELRDRDDVEYGSTGDAENNYRPSDYSNARGQVNLNKLQRYGGGTNSVDYGRSTSRIVNPGTFTTRPLSSIGRINEADGEVRYTLIRLARMKMAKFRYLPYEKFIRWTQTNMINEAKKQYSASSQAEYAAGIANAGYKMLLDEHGTVLDDDAISKFPLNDNNRVNLIASLESKEPYVAKRTALAYNDLFVTALRAISSPSTGDSRISNSVNEFVKLGTTDNNLLMSLETEAKNTIDGETIPQNVIDYLNAYIERQAKQEPIKIEKSPEEERIERIIKLAKDQYGKNPTPQEVQQAIIILGQDGDKATEKDIADLLESKAFRVSRKFEVIRENRRKKLFSGIMLGINQID